MRLRFQPTLMLALLVASCSNPSAPSQSSVLRFTFSPNPVPTAGVVFAGCTGQVAPAKTWLYTLKIENRSSTPFVISSLSSTLKATGSSTPFTQDYDQATAALAFGSATIPSAGSVSGGLCTFLSVTSGSVSYSFKAADGRGPFSTEDLQLLP